MYRWFTSTISMGCHRPCRLLNKVLQTMVGKVSGKQASDDGVDLSVLHKNCLQRVVTGEGIGVLVQHEHVCRTAFHKLMRNLSTTCENAVKENSVG